MRKTKKVVAALFLASIMAAMALMHPIAVMAAETQQAWEEQGFLPVREIFEYDDVTVTWNDAEGNIHIAMVGVSIVLYPGSNVAYVDGAAIEMQHAIVLEDGISYIYFYDLLLVMDAVIEIYFEANWSSFSGFGSDYGFMLSLTEEARDIVLYDFDYLMNVILENTPWQSVIYRSLGLDFLEYIVALREIIEDMYPITSSFTVEEYGEFLGIPMYEYWFPLRDSDDPRYIAATYISYFLMSAAMPLGGIGHLGPRTLPMFRVQYSSLRFLYYHGYINRQTDPDGAMRFDTFTHPDVVWFYGEVEVDLYDDFEAVFPEVPGNIITEIIIPGEVAYLRINSFATSAAFDDLTIAPFFEEIRDFDHLIIDIRGNGGGFMFNFTHNIMGRLIHEAVEIVTHQFFSGGDIAVKVMNALLESTRYRFDSIENNAVYEWYTIDIMPAQQFIDERNMTAFNQDDLAHLQYVIVERDWIFPTGDGLTFDGKVWLLVDSRSASASSQAALMLMDTGLATVVGTNTSGVMAAHHVYIRLPNTGLLFRVDLGYRTDAYGNSLEAYGIAPHVRNFLGMNALETVLELIADPYAGERLENRADFDLAEFFTGDDVDFTGHPLIGTWAWDTDDSFVYVFRPDGTATRGFYGNRFDFYWYVYGNHLFMYVIDIFFGTFIEHWTFTIYDDVLTIVSAQVPGMTWSYVR